MRTGLLVILGSRTGSKHPSSHLPTCWGPIEI